MTDTEVFYGTIHDALLRDRKPISQTVIVDGQVIDAFDIRTTHAIDQPIGTCEFTVDASLQLPLGAPVLIQGGYGAPVGTIFNGKLPDDDYSMSESGWYTRYNAIGWSSLLSPPVRRDHIFPIGKISLRDIFFAFCAMRGVQNFYSDDTIITNSSAEILLGGIPQINNGSLVITKGTSPLDWMNRIANLFGYYIFDTPGGIVRLKKILHPPTEAMILASYVEGGHVIQMNRGRKSTQIINDWEIKGASYKDENDIDVSIRTFPLTVPNEPLLAPLNYQHAEITEQELVTLELAEGVRQTQEIRAASLNPVWAWTVEGDPERSPGDAVFVRSEKLNDESNVLVMSITQTISEEGYWADMTGWAGNGIAQPPGEDCIEIDVFTGVRHLGNEYLNNYHNKAHQGIEYKIPFTIPDAYSSLSIHGFAHGTNSFSRGQESTASRFEIYQGSPLEKVAEGELPRQLESLSTPYSVLSNWPDIHVPLQGGLQAGPAELWILSGVDTAVGDRDDFEFRDLKLRACGIGQPVYPSEVL